MPLCTLLGFALPIYFLGFFEPCLYLLRPIELPPAYGTAWLVLGAVTVPFLLLAALLLGAIGTIPILLPVRPLQVLRQLIERTLIGLGAAAAIAALAYGAMVWLHSLGGIVDESFGLPLALASLASGILLALTSRGRALVLGLSRPCAWTAMLGALAAISVPFFDWPAEAAARGQIDPGPATARNTAAPSSAPNILLLTFDALSAEHMSLYGAQRPTTPSLEQFARSATTFEHAYANANFTTSGISSILTGTRPWTHRALLLAAWPLAAARRDSLPALLHRRGYLMGYVSTSPWAGAGKNGFGDDFDFASYDRIHSTLFCRDRLSTLFRYSCLESDSPLFAEIQNVLTKLRRPGDNRGFDPRLAIEPALQWLSRAAGRGRPVFLWVHLLPPHAPYATPPPWLGRFDPSPDARRAGDSSPPAMYRLAGLAPRQLQTFEARYDEDIRYADHYAGEFLRRALPMLGEDTVVVVTADHGESFRHGYGQHGGPALYDEIIHIPLIVKFPGQREPIRSPVLAEQVDIAPTLAELAGITPPRTWEGRALHEVSPPDPPADPADTQAVFSMSFEQSPRFASLTNGSVAVIDGSYKLIHYLGRLRYRAMPVLHDELYDLSQDPGELKNLARARPDVVRRLLGLIQAQLAIHGGPIH